MKRLLLALTLLFTLAAGQPRLSTLPAAAAAPCTAFLSPGQPVPPWIAQGAVLCLHGGTYPHDALLPITTNGATYMSAPGDSERARIVGVGVTLYGHDVTLANLEFDTGGVGGPSVPAVRLNGDHLTLDHDTVTNGHYNGVELRGSWLKLLGNTIYNFDASPTDAECVTVFQTADHLVLQGNTIHDCSGNGIELFTADQGTASPVSDDVLIDSNTIWRGTLPHSETLIGLKHGNWVTITNNLLSGNADYNWALGARGNTRHVLMEHNTLTGNYTGIELGQLNGAAASDIMVRDNVIDNLGGPDLGQLGGGFGVEFTMCLRCDFVDNVIRHAVIASIWIEGNGLQGGSIRGNTISDSAAARQYPGAIFSNVAVGPNSWTNAPAGFLARPGDTTGPGLPVTPTATTAPTITPTATASSTPTATATATASPAPTDSPTATSSPTSPDTPTATSTATATPRDLGHCFEQDVGPAVVITCQG